MAYIEKITSNLPAGFMSAAGHKLDTRWNYAIKHLLLRGEVSLLVGEANTGKTAFVGAMAKAIITGAPLAEHRVTQGAVVHVAAEARESVLDRAQVLFWNDADKTPLEKYIVPEAAVPLDNPEAVINFINNIGKLPVAPVLVVLDTLALSLGEADENANGDMTRVINQAQRIALEANVHVMLVHHLGKDTERGARGASALRASVDTVLTLGRDKNSGALRVHDSKQRNMSCATQLDINIDTIAVGKDEDGEPRCLARAHVSPAAPILNPQPRAEKASVTKRHLRQSAIEAAVRGLMRCDPALSAASIPIDTILDCLPAQMHDEMGQPESQKKAVREALKQLKEEAQPLFDRDTAGGS